MVYNFRLTAATSPVHILESIFCYLATGALEPPDGYTWITENRPHATLYGGKKDLHTVSKAALVNKHWNSVATDVLYEAIEVCDYSSDRATAICETLRMRPRLARNVRRLTLFAVSGFDSETFYRVQLLWLCRNVQHLQLRQWNHDRLEDCFRVLLQLKNLKTFSIEGVQEPFASLVCGYQLFCQSEDLFHLMQAWPRIEHVQAVHEVLADVDDGVSSPPTVLIPGGIKLITQLSSLRVLKLSEVCVSGSELDTISRTAPCLQVLEFGRPANGCDPRFSALLCEALGRWKDCLQELAIYLLQWGLDYWEEDVWDERVECRAHGSQLAEAISNLRRLRCLRLGPCFPMEILAAAFPPSLQDLQADVLEEDLRFLADALKRRDYLPSLGALSVHEGVMDTSFYEARAVVMELHNACEERDIELDTTYWQDYEM